jgi:hypothetical protein
LTSFDITASSGDGGTTIARSRARMWPVSMIVQGFDSPAAFAPDQELRDGRNRLLRRRQPDARQPFARQMIEPLQRQRQVAAALGRRQRMDFVDDHRVRRRQHGAARFGAEQDVQRLRRGHHDVRGALAHLRALRLRRIAGAHEGPDLDLRQAHPLQLFLDSGDRHFEIEPDVVRQRLQR